MPKQLSKQHTISIDVINALISSIEEINTNSSENIILNIPAYQFSELINCLFDYTKRLAKANNINSDFINRPKIFEKKDYSDLQYYLKVQKGIFEKAT